MVNRVTGEVLPSISAFHFVEGAASKDDKFIRGSILGSANEIKTWRERFNNIGIFRSYLIAGRPDFLEAYRDEATLFYGDLMFDLDITKSESIQEMWPKLVMAVETELLPKLCADLHIQMEQIKIWFSGSRGMHIGVPSASMGVWPDHDLNRVYSHIAGKQREGILSGYIDMSLYGNKHLFRMENSIHQKTGLYKFPLRASELRAVKSYENMVKIATKPRDYTNLWGHPTPNSRSQLIYDTMYSDALTITSKSSTPVKPRASTDGYNRSNWWCINHLFSDGFMLEQGHQMNIIFLICSHLHQEGFTFEQAESEVSTWAAYHCDPPFPEARWRSALEREYRSDTIDLPAGCSYVQRLTPQLCREDICPIGKRVIRNREMRSQISSQNSHK